MKKHVSFILVMLIGILSYGQTDGISYQAVIIDNNPQEIPGVDVPSNNLPNTALKVRFSIIDNTNQIEYQETQDTETDAFGMINLMIGQGELTSETLTTFNQVYWDNEKFLRVEIDLFDGNGFVEFSYQKLTYIPYIRHREIIATSTLDVDGATNLNNSLSVNNASPTLLSGSLTTDGTTDLNSNLTVNNQSPTYLTGDLTVDGLVSFDGELAVGGDTNLYSDLTVAGNSLLEGDLNVLGTSNFADGIFDNITVNQNSLLNTLTASGATNLSNLLNVNGTTTLNNTLFVNANSFLNGRVIIDTNVDDAGGDLFPTAYPLWVKGSKQGITIELNGNAAGGTPNNGNNFLSFKGANNIIYGRIEGQTNNELTSSFPFIWNQTQEGLETGFQLAMVTADLFGVDDFDAAAIEGFEMVDMIANWVVLRVHMQNNVGVAFESGFGDYAEWLEKKDVNEIFSYGDIVGVSGGKITKNTTTADHFMVVSKNPIVLGNMPENNREKDFEKIAFMGQIPVKVLGKVSIGDYIIPSGLNDGIGRAVSPKNMTVEHYKTIVGVAWSESDARGISYINLAVGINTNDTLKLLEQQQDEINMLKSEVSAIVLYLKQKDPNFDAEFFNLSEYTNRDNEVVNSDNENQTHIANGEYTTTKSKFELILSFLEENPDVIEGILADARAYLDAKKVNYKLYEQTNRVVTDKNYLLDNLRAIIKDM
ncbi:peptidase G2 autoproteolytic cleavage domain-containing protein [Psychroserpens sp. SPM9]|uniref:peptidase G2 autoproteolytic cleavage domain-containing protein n=1 Tax=Psychroserpens sp. SPM9 TaxID=2975598 RepID=UPI0021A31267|nr:peptidase G2 autoproteolytic cleavage domain-containing protein [Psychroserpens sp. SPM9]MDG5492413.1 peptidase G2 autoproteolytic cleavage domain-containing protein [Psychroserpens sp. SPM9]